MRCILFSLTLYVLCTLANAMPSIANAMPAVSWASHWNLWLTITITMYLLFMLKQMGAAGIKIINVVCLCTWLLPKVVTATIAERIYRTHAWWLYQPQSHNQEETAELMTVTSNNRNTAGRIYRTHSSLAQQQKHVLVSAANCGIHIFMIIDWCSVSDDFVTSFKEMKVRRVKWLGEIHWPFIFKESPFCWTLCKWENLHAACAYARR